MNIRLAVAVVAGKATGTAVRRLGRGGTALPGLVASSIDSEIVARLGRQISSRVLVTGTNGKTTTCRIVEEMLGQAGICHLHNREGSNLTRGFASTLLGPASLQGALSGFEVGLFETDEATLPAAVGALQPQVVAFTNLFRDQLDRYGEVDTVATIWRDALRSAPPGCTLILNADDPLVASLEDCWTGPIHRFGLDLPAADGGDRGIGDARWCPSCGAPLEYDRRYFAHIGRWACGRCGRKAPDPETRARQVRIDRDGSSFLVDGSDEPERFPLAGAYNVYNALAALAICRVMGVPDTACRRGLAAVRPAFGRQEVIEYGGRRLRLLLSKNPAGANQVLRFLRDVSDAQGGIKAALLLNDRIADSRDVSWIWDVDYELLAPQIGACWASGLRAEEMALRLKYAGWPPVESIAHTPAALLDALLAGTKPGEETFVLPTYTAMLELRAALVERGAVSPYWERRR